jgi:hypothetical protein
MLLLLVAEAVGLRWGEHKGRAATCSSPLLCCDIGRAEDRPVKGSGRVPSHAAPLLKGVAQDVTIRVRWRLDFPVAQDAWNDPNVGWHLRDGLSAPGRSEDRHHDPGRPAVRPALVQEQFSDVDGISGEDRPKDSTRITAACQPASPSRSIRTLGHRRNGRCTRTFS